MSYQCPFCPRTFSTRSAYSQHLGHCVPDQSSSEESNDQNIEMNESYQSFSNYSGQSMLISEDSNQSISADDDNQSMLISDSGNRSISEGGD